MSTRKHWRGHPRWPRAPGPDPSRLIPHETIRRVNEYVEQRQRLLNRKQGTGGACRRSTTSLGASHLSRCSHQPTDAAHCTAIRIVGSLRERNSANLEKNSEVN